MSWAVWITGPPGSGKSALAQGAAKALDAIGLRVTVLELDAIRKIVTPAPTYSAAEREVVYRGLVWAARTLTECGVPVIIDATAHRRAWRDLARAAIPRFAEVQLVCPLEVCRERERARVGGHAPRGVYAAAGRPGATVPGVDVPYEPSVQPDLLIDTAREEVPAAVAKIVALGRQLARTAPGSRVTWPAPWAIWITGLPGSGKTTLAFRVADALVAEGTAVQVLELADVASFLLGGARPTAGEEELIYRTLVATAKLLTEAGIAAIVDAMAPRRQWRQLARSLIPSFAEVQLVCPLEVCYDRERAARWHLGFCAGPARPKVAPEEGLDRALSYEPALNPDLTIHTDLRDVASAAAEVLRLARRLQRAAARTVRSA